MQLKQALALKGYTVRDLYEKMSKQYLVNYQIIAKYCRCNNRLRLDKTMWSWIDKTLKEMEVEWNER